MKHPELPGAGPCGKRPLSTGSQMTIRHRLGFRTAGMRAMPLAKALETIAGAGYSLVEFCMEHPEAERYRGDLFGLGISAVSYHGKKDAPNLRRAGISKAMEKAVELRASLLVLGSPVGSATAGFLGECHWVMDRLPEGVRPAWEPEPGTTLGDLVVFNEMAGMLGPRAGLNLDFGHAFIDGLSPRAATGLSGGRLLHVHIEDVSGTAHKHLVPGQGSFPWEELMPSLDDIGYSGPLVIDLFTLPSEPFHYVRRALHEALYRLGVE